METSSRNKGKRFSKKTENKIIYLNKKFYLKFRKLVFVNVMKVQMNLYFFGF